MPGFITFRHMMIGVAVSAMILALWDASTRVRRAYWLSLARVHAETEQVSLESAPRTRGTPGWSRPP